MVVARWPTWRWRRRWQRGRLARLRIVPGRRSQPPGSPRSAGLHDAIPEAADWSSLCGRVGVSGLVSYRPVLVRRAHLTVGGIATELEELKSLIRPGTGSRATAEC